MSQGHRQSRRTILAEHHRACDQGETHVSIYTPVEMLIQKPT